MHLYNIHQYLKTITNNEKIAHDTHHTIQKPEKQWGKVKLLKKRQRKTIPDK